MTCYLIVKSDATLVDKKEFENWYANEHLSEAMKAFVLPFSPANAIPNNFPQT